MTHRDEIEQKICEVLATEHQAIKLSNRLFQPDGLFNQLATTEEERRTIAATPLFREAQRRLSELQKREAAEFAEAVRQTQAALPPGDYLVKWERAERA
jgi:hypothetical protein